MIYICYNDRDNILTIIFVIVLDMRSIIQFFNIITHTHNDADHHYQLTVQYHNEPHHIDSSHGLYDFMRQRIPTFHVLHSSKLHDL